jgi:Fe-S oxidoreductase
MAARTVGISTQRPFPRFTWRHARPRIAQGDSRILLLRDPFTHYVELSVEQAAFELLAVAGYDVHVLNTMGAGASLISHGFLAAARQHTTELLRELNRADPTGSLPLMVIEPSELSALRHDCADLIPEVLPAARKRLAGAQSVEEFLVGTRWFANLHIASGSTALGFHPHCHDSAETNDADGALKVGQAGINLLRGCGYQVEPLATGCCGMAGTFGYEAEHYELSQRILQRRLLPSVRELAERKVAATGAACRMQISQSGEADAEHPLVFAARALISHRVLAS